MFKGLVTECMVKEPDKYINSSHGVRGAMESYFMGLVHLSAPYLGPKIPSGGSSIRTRTHKLAGCENIFTGSSKV